MARTWDLIVIFDDGSERQLNTAPFVGNAMQAGDEAERLASDLEGVGSFVLESWGTVVSRKPAGGKPTLPSPR